MILPFLTQKVMHACQVISICCKSSAYEQANLVNCLQSYYFLLNVKKKKKKKKKFHLCIFLISSVYIHTYNSEAVKINSERKVQGTDSFFNPKEFIRISVL